MKYINNNNLKIERKIIKIIKINIKMLKFKNG